MGSEIELNAGLAKFKVDLSEFASAMQRLVAAAVGENEKEQARDAMKVLLGESATTFKTIVQTLTPLFALEDERAFNTNFASTYAEFKRLYLERKTLHRTHCGIVEDAFNKLGQRRAWMTHVPVAKNAYADLEKVCGRWLFQDWKIVQDMEAFLAKLNEFLSDLRL